MEVTKAGYIVDVQKKRIYFGEVSIKEGYISSILELEEEGQKGHPYILPGFIDSHVHIESSMLVPSEFAKLAVVHGTVATISDPHEIANVCGMEGVQYMIENGNTVPFKFNFGAPSCVPATSFETAGATLTPNDVDLLLQKPEIRYLSEMMNFPGVLYNDPDVLSKIASAKKYNKPVDGHAPGLMGEDAKRYIDAGITTDHECFTEEEAVNKLSYGMKILIREGSAAKNFEALISLLHHHEDRIMFCSDDKHPDSLAEGHINVLCARAVAKGIDIFKILKAACINPVVHYKMDVGLLQVGHKADMILVDDLIQFNVQETIIDGIVVSKDGRTLITGPQASIINQFACDEILPEQLQVSAKENTDEIPVIEAIDGQLITNRLMITPKIIRQQIVTDVENDILKIVVINRYNKASPAIAFIKNFGMTTGAIASTVAHDSHNIVAIGTDDTSLADAINLVIKVRGGVSAVGNNEQHVLPLPVAGLMSNEDGYKVAAAYTSIDAFVKDTLRSTLSAPFMTLSFMALLVIPHLKLSDKGLFDGDRFEIIQ